MFNFSFSRIWSNIQSDQVSRKAFTTRLSLDDQVESDQPHIPDLVWQESYGEVLDDIFLVSRMNIYPANPGKAAGSQGCWKLAGELPDARGRQAKCDALPLYRLVAERPKGTSWPISIRQQTALQLSAGLDAHRSNRVGR